MTLEAVVRLCNNKAEEWGMNFDNDLWIGTYSKQIWEVFSQLLSINTIDSSDMY